MRSVCTTILPNHGRSKAHQSPSTTVLSRYLWRIAAIDPTAWQLKGVAVAAYTLAVICVLAHNKWSLYAVNVFGIFKVLLLVVISITGLVVLGGNTHIPDPQANFRNSFAGTTTNGNDLANAIVNIVFSYTGLVAEILVLTRPETRTFISGS